MSSAPEDQRLIGLLNIPTATEAGVCHFESFISLFVSDDGARERILSVFMEESLK